MRDCTGCTIRDERDFALAQADDLGQQLRREFARTGRRPGDDSYVQNVGSFLKFSDGEHEVNLATIDGTSTADAHRIVDSIIHRLAEQRAAIPPGPHTTGDTPHTTDDTPHTTDDTPHASVI